MRLAQGATRAFVSPRVTPRTPGRDSAGRTPQYPNCSPGGCASPLESRWSLPTPQVRARSPWRGVPRVRQRSRRGAHRAGIPAAVARSRWVPWRLPRTRSEAAPWRAAGRGPGRQALLTCRYPDIRALSMRDLRPHLRHHPRAQLARRPGGRGRTLSALLAWQCSAPGSSALLRALGITAGAAPGRGADRFHGRGGARGGVPAGCSPRWCERRHQSACLRLAVRPAPPGRAALGRAGLALVAASSRAVSGVASAHAPIARTCGRNDARTAQRSCWRLGLFMRAASAGGRPVIIAGVLRE